MFSYLPTPGDALQMVLLYKVSYSPPALCRGLCRTPTLTMLDAALVHPAARCAIPTWAAADVAMCRFDLTAWQWCMPFCA